MHETSNEKILKLLEELVFLQGLIATELIQITENTSAAIRDGKIPEKCKKSHRLLRESTIKLVEKYHPENGSELREHVLKH